MSPGAQHPERPVRPPINEDERPAALGVLGGAGDGVWLSREQAAKLRDLIQWHGTPDAAALRAALAGGSGASQAADPDAIMEENESGPAALERPGPGNRKRGSDAGG